MDHRALVLDFSAVPYIDSTAAKCGGNSGTQRGPPPRRRLHLWCRAGSPAALATHGVEAPLVRYETTLDAAFAAGHQLLAAQSRRFPPSDATR